MEILSQLESEDVPEHLRISVGACLYLTAFVLFNQPGANTLPVSVRQDLYKAAQESHNAFNESKGIEPSLEQTARLYRIASERAAEELAALLHYSGPVFLAMPPEFAGLDEAVKEQMSIFYIQETMA